MPGIRCLIRKAQPRRWTLVVSKGVRAFLPALVFLGLGLMADTSLWAAGEPVITNSPLSFTAVVGQNHTFTVVAGGTAPLGYFWYKNGSLLPGETSTALTLTSIQTSHAGAYRVVVSNAVSTATSQVATLTVRLPSDPKFAAPNGGWHYQYEGVLVAAAGTAALDGTWNHDNSSDSWGGDGRGAGDGPEGGMESASGVLSIEDAVLSGTTSTDNRRLYLTHNLTQEPSVPNPSTLLDDGVTLSFRTRLTPPPPTDPLTELTNAPNGYVNVSDGKGMFGLRQSGGGGMMISFSLNQTNEDRVAGSPFDFVKAGLHMNNLNGDVRSPNVDPSEEGTLNLLALDPTIFHEFWINIQANGTDPGTHKVSIYTNGNLTPIVFNVTGGTGSDTPANDYLAMGLGSTFQRGGFDVDYFSYRAGLIDPVGFNVPLSITSIPVTQYVGVSQTATFRVGVAGTPPYKFQWYKNGSAVNNATNQTYTTPAAVLGDDGAAFTVVVQGDINSVTSSPPATLEVILPPAIVTQPQNRTTTNTFPAALSVTASGEAISGYQWRFNSSNLTGETNATLTIAAATPAHAGSYDVIVTNPAGSAQSNPATLTVLGQDFGDAPDPTYPTLLSHNGARHLIVSGVRLGALNDLEADGQPNASATGDDVAGSADEDGVVFNTPVQAGQTVSLQVTASASGFLEGWVDFQRDGSWAESGDRIFTSRALVAGANALTFSVPPSAAAGASTARFRFCSTSGLSFDGPAADGEVEDYAVDIIPLTDLGVQVTDTPDPIATGTTLTYAITVTNIGPSIATGVHVTNTLPTQVAYLSSFPSQGTCQENAGKVQCTLGNLNSGQAVTITITGTALAAGLHTNTTVVVGNELDPVSANNTFLVVTRDQDVPSITGQPQSLTVTNGNSATFAVTASGTQPLFYQWFFNGSPLLNQTNTTLVLAAAVPANEGNYTVRVTNDVNAVLSQVATLTVLVPPSISVQPVTQTVFAGTNVTLSVQANGTAPLAYQWFINSTTPVGGATSASLLLPNIQIASGGSYHVRITNAAGILNSSAAVLTVVEIDFGDAPAAYPVTLASNGARHRLVANTFLGTGVDFEPDGAPTAGATGDDAAGSDDEDGVRFTTPVLVGQNATVEVVASVSGVLDGWLDFNLNGNWSDASERIFNGRAVSAGINLLTVAVPANATPGQAAARFRFSLAGVSSFTGEAPNGEVEDLLADIKAAVNLAIAQTAGPNPVAVGSNLVYSISVTNLGPSPASGVVTTNTLPAGTTYIGAVPSQGNCVLDNGVVICSLGAMNAAATATIQMTLVPTAAGNLSNTILVASQETELNAANNTSNVTVDAQVFPTITTQPQNLTVTNGNPANLTVVASGTALRYQWRFNGAEMAGQINPTMSIASSQSANQGTYNVRITNGVGAVTSAPVTLTVLVPVNITGQPQSATVVQGRDTTLSVTATGSGPLTYQWRFQGAPISGATSPTLTLTAVQSANAGSYVVEVGNILGTVQSSAAVLTVLVPPTYLAQPQSQTNLAGSTVTLQVTVTGSQPLSYQWYFNDSVALSGATQPLLNLVNVQKNQSGLYSVVVSNAGGTNSSEHARVDIIEVDFGDAPYPPYPSLYAYNGAHHHIVPGIVLGPNVDFEPDAFANPDASGDDTHGADDDDGVVFNAPLRVGQNASVTVTASINGFLDGWIDFNANGSWNDPGENVFHAQPVVAGANNLVISTPLTAALAPTFARFRYGTSSSGFSVDGYAANGEVEDYQVSIQPAVNLVVDRVIAPRPVVVTSNIVMDLLVTNLGPSTATQVRLTNDLPANLNWVSTTSSQGTCDTAGGRTTCDLGPLAVGEFALMRITATTMQIGLATNRVSVRSAEFDTNLSNNDAVDVIPVVLPATQWVNSTTLTLQDNGPASLYPSTIQVSGLTAAVYKVTVTLSNLSHTFPDDFDILLVGPGGQNVLLMSDALGNFFMNNVSIILDDDAPQALPNSGAVVPGERYRPTDHGVTQDVFPAPAPVGPYGAALSVFAGTNPNGVWSLYALDDFPEDFGLIRGGWSLRIQTIDPFADMAIAKFDAPSPVAVGSNFVYSVLVTNQGPNTATAVVLNDALPAGVAAVGAVPSQGNCSVGPNLVQCTLGSLNAGAFALINIEVTANQIRRVTNTVSVAAAQLDLVPQNNQSSVATSITPIVDLASSQSASASPALLESPVVFSITVTNQGVNPATAVRLLGQPPPNAVPVSVTPSQGTCTGLGPNYQCDLGNLAVGATASVALVVRPTALGFITNRAEVRAAEVDGRGTNDLSELSLAVAPAANLVLAGSATPSPVVVTRDTTYGLAVTNLGPSEATGVVLTFPLPANGNLANASSSQGGCVNNAGIVTCTFGILAPGASATATLGVTALASGFLSNNISVVAVQSDPIPANNLLTLVVGVDPAVNLALSVADGPDPVVVGQPLIYTIAVANQGPNQATGVVLRDPIPAGLNYVSSVASQGNCVLDVGTVRCDLGSIAAAANVNVTLTMTPTLSGHLTNTFHVVANEVDLVPANNDVLESTMVVVLQPPQTNATSIVLGAQGSAALYPSTIVVSGVTASVQRVSVTLNRLHHDRPDDMDILLVGPRGQNVMLMSDAGGTTAVTNIDLTFTASAAGTLGDASTLASGTFRPTNFDPASDALAAPAPAGPHGSDFGAFTGTNPNGTWSLYVFDDQALLAGGLKEGWSLQLSTLDPIADLAISQLAAPNPVGVSSNLTVIMTVTNQGPAQANQVLLSSSIPSQLGQVQAVPTQGNCFVLNGLVTCNLNNIAVGAFANVTMTALVVADGTVTNLATVQGLELDLVPANNASSFSVQAAQPPVFVLQPLSQSVTNGSVVSFTAQASGAAPLAYQWQFNGTDLPGATASTLNLGTVTLSNEGSYRVRATNQVGNAFSATAQLVVRVPPTILPPSDATTNEDIPTAPLPFVVNDLETPAGALQVFGSSSNPTLVPAGSFNFAGTTGNRTVSVRPATNQFGTATITLTVRDGDGMEAITTFGLTVNPLNDPPSIADIPNQATPEDTPTGLIHFTVTDPETSADTVTLTKATSNAGLVPLNNIALSGSGSDRTIAITPAPNLFGTATITVTATDPLGLSRDEVFVLTVVPINDPPTLNSIGDLTIDEDASVQTIALSGIGSGASNESQFLNVSASSGNTSLIANTVVIHTSPNATANLFLVPVAQANGLAVITVSVNDGGSENPVFSRQFTVTVRAVNDAPTIGPLTPQSTLEDTALTVAVPVGDIDSSLAGLVLTANVGNTNLLPLANIQTSGTGPTRNVILLPGTNQFGTTTVTLTVTDENGTGLSTPASFPFTVTSINDPPALNPIADLVLVENSGMVEVPVTGIHSGATNEFQTLEMTVTSSNPTLIPDPQVVYTSPGSSGLLRLAPTPNMIGTAFIRVTLDDGQADNALGIRSFVVTVQPPDTPPAISPIPNQNVPEDSPLLTVPVYIFDLESPASTLMLSMTSSNPQVLPDQNISQGGSGPNRTITLRPLPNQFGAATVSVTVTANNNVSTLTTFVLNVQPVNDPSTLDPINDVSLDEDGPPRVVALTGIGSGVANELQTLEVRASSSRPELIPHPVVTYTSPGAAGTLTLVPAPNASGSATITVVVDDGSDAQNLTARTFLVTLNQVNDVPTISAISNQTLNRGQASPPIGFLIADLETAANALGVTVSSDNAGLIPDANIALGGTGNARTLTLTPLANATGTAVITVRVDDLQGGVTNRAFNLTVQTVNAPPSITGLADVTLTEDAAPRVLNFNVSDPETAAGSLGLTASSSNTDLIPNANLQPGGTGSARTLTVTPAPNKSGLSTISVTASDGSGGQTVATFVVTVDAVNDTPSLSQIPNQTMNANTVLTLAVQVQDIDSPLAGLNLSGSSSVAGLVPAGGFSFTGTGAGRHVQITPAANQTGTAQISIVVTDPAGAKATNTFQLVVNAATGGFIPVITKQPDSLSVSNGQPAAFTASASGSQPMQFQWQLNGANLAGQTSPTLNLASVQPSNQGSYRMIASNSSGSATSQVATLTLFLSPNPNGPTLSSIGPQSTGEDTPITVPFTVGASDAEAFGVTLSGSSSNVGLVPNASIAFSGFGSNRTVTLTPVANLSGSANITVFANNGVGISSNTFTLTVTAVNDPPTLDQPANIVRNEGPTSFNVPLTGIGTGAANETQTLNVSATSSATGIISIQSVSYTSPAATGTLVLKPANNTTGFAAITVTVNDNQGVNNTFSRTFFVHSKDAANTVPTITSVGNQTINEDTSTGLLAFTVGDAQTAVGSLVVTQQTSNPLLLPLSGIALGGSGASRNVNLTPLPNQTGTATVTLVVVDGGTGAAQTQFDLIVNPDNDLPTVSDIIGQSTAEDTVSNLIPYTVGDLETPASGILVSASSSNSGLVPDANIALGGVGASRALRITPSPNQSGVSTITLAVSDGTGGLSNRVFNFTVNAINDLPQISAIADQTTGANTAVGPIAFTIGDTETAAGTLNLGAASSNPALVLATSVSFGGSGANRTATITPNAGQSGFALITITVTDQGGATRDSAFGLFVSASGANNPPTLDTIGDVVVGEDAGPQVVSLTGISSGAGQPNQPVSIVAVSGNPALVPDPLITYTHGAPTGTLTFQPLQDAHGSASISVTVDDGQAGNGTLLRVFNITVQPTNDAPTLSAIADRAIPVNAVLGPLAFTIDDVETPEDTLTLVADSSDLTLVPRSNIVLGGAGTARTVTITPAPNRTGSTIITLTADDGTNFVSSAFSLSVGQANTLPTISSVNDLVVNEDAVLAPVAFTIGDAETLPGSLKVEVVSSNAALLPSTGIVLGGANANRTATLTLNPNAHGVTEITLLVSDQAGATAQESFTLTVNSINDPPVLLGLESMTVDEDAAVGVIALQLNDAETPVANLALIAQSSNPSLVAQASLVLDGTNQFRSLKFHLEPNQFGNAVITVTATDGDGGSSTNQFTLTVLPVNDAPSVTPIADIATLPGVATPAVAFTIGDDETVVTALTVVATSSNPAVVPEANIHLQGSESNRTVSVTPDVTRAGSSVITIRVTDSAGLATLETFLLVSDKVNTVPTISNIPDQSARRNVELGPIPFTVGDAEDAAEALMLSADSSQPNLISPDNIHFGGEGSNRTLTILPSANQVGQATITVLVTDLDGDFASTTFVVTVNLELTPNLITHIDRTGTTAAVTFTTANGLLYTVEFKDGFSAPPVWGTLPTVNGTGNPLTVVDPNTPGPMRIYRVRVH